MAKERIIRFRCPDCKKEIEEVDRTFVKEYSAYSHGNGLGKNYCSNCATKYYSYSAEEREILASEIVLDEIAPENVAFKMDFKKEFIFDKEGYKLFLEEFCTEEYKIDVLNDYLVRKYLGQKKEIKPIDFFHRWYMGKIGEIKKFEESSNLYYFDVHVHHKDGNKQNNCLKNLKCKGKKDHFDEHEKERLWEEFKNKFYRYLPRFAEDEQMIRKDLDEWINKIKKE